MEILMRYNNDGMKDLLLSIPSYSGDTYNTLLKYLNSINIPLVENLPQTQGIFCTPDKEDRRCYDVFQIVYDKEEQLYNPVYTYSLEWLLLKPEKPEEKANGSSLGLVENIPV